VELKSLLDRLSKLKSKMQEWIANGAKIGWLFDLDQHTVGSCRQGREPEQLVNPERVGGEGPVPGFVLELARIWAGP
jgi:Uma2 family endonuclease